ncbi:MAG: mechanosensitive ion channel family protein [Thermoplasmata archaeon]|nr:mechanosensitive ion channel family protein [Thermoplasmata archaeon]
MRGRLVALFAAVLSVAMFLAPALCEPADAISDGDYRVTIPQWEGPGTINYITIGNGHTMDIVVYVENFTDHYMDVDFAGETYYDYIHGSRIANVTLPPADGETALMIEETFVISADETAPARVNLDLDLVITITDLYDGTSEKVVVMFEVEVVNAFDLTSSFNRFFGIIPNTLPAPFNTSMTAFLVTLAAFIGIALLAAMALMPVFRRYTYMGTRYKGWRLLWPLGLATVSISLLIFTQIGPWILGYDLTTTDVVERVCTAILVVMLFVAVWKGYSAAVYGLLRRIDTDEGYKQNTLGPVLSSLGMVALWGVGAAIILIVMGVDPVSVLVSSSLITLGVSIGAKDVLSRMFNGINIILSKRFRVGDFITVGDHHYFVRYVGIMYTELWGKKRDRVTVVPNNTMAELPVEDSEIFTDSYVFMVDFTVPYGTDLKALEAKVLEFANGLDFVKKGEDIGPSFRLQSFDDSGIRVALKVWKPFNISEKRIRRLLYEMLQKEGINVPYSRLEIMITNGESGDSMESDWRSKE